MTVSILVLTPYEKSSEFAYPIDMKMHIKMESRVSLSEKGYALGLHKELLLPEGVDSPKYFQVAECFEAVVGAIYLDSGKSVEVVKKVISDIKLDDHQYLKPQSTSRDYQERKEKWYHHAEGVLLEERTAFLEREALKLRKDTKDFDASVAKQRDKPNIYPQMHVTAKTKAEILEHKATTLEDTTEDANACIEEQPRGNFTVESQIQEHIQRRIESLESLSPRRKKENANASGEDQKGDKLVTDLQTQAVTKENDINNLEPIVSDKKLQSCQLILEYRKDLRLYVY